MVYSDQHIDHHYHPDLLHRAPQVEMVDHVKNLLLGKMIPDQVQIAAWVEQVERFRETDCLFWERHSHRK